jgi:hypothetical protein
VLRRGRRQAALGAAGGSGKPWRGTSAAKPCLRLRRAMVYASALLGIDRRRSAGAVLGYCRELVRHVAACIYTPRGRALVSDSPP